MKNYGIINKAVADTLSLSNTARYLATTMFIDPFYIIDKYDRQSINKILKAKRNSGARFLDILRNLDITVTHKIDLTETGFHRTTKIYYKGNPEDVGIYSTVFNHRLPNESVGLFVKLYLTYGLNRLPSLSKISKDLNMSRTTVNKYIPYLKASSLFIGDKINPRYINFNIDKRRYYVILGNIKY